jgi:hypothetical protein
LNTLLVEVTDPSVTVICSARAGFNVTVFRLSPLVNVAGEPDS